jgi:formylmethanofuran dehydrogenase subunit E
MRQADYLTDLDGLIAECCRLHGHICPGQLLGVRMATLGCQLVAIGAPRGVDRKELIIWVEIDRCVTDPISAVTGVRLGKRSLKYQDYGKVATTLMNFSEKLSVRIVAIDDSGELANALYPEIETKKERQMLTYRHADASSLFSVEQVLLELNELEMPGRPRKRIASTQCGEGINDGREMTDALNRIVCRPCGLGTDYQKFTLTEYRVRPITSLPISVFPLNRFSFLPLKCCFCK